MEKEVKIDAPFITLGQLLKEEGIIPTGGAAKWFLKEHEVKVNRERISSLAKTRFKEAFSTFKIFPRIGKMA